MVEAWRVALALCVAHQLRSWDALMLNVAPESGGCRLLECRSQSRLKWARVRVVNLDPSHPDPLLQLLCLPLADSGSPLAPD